MFIKLVKCIGGSEFVEYVFTMFKMSTTSDDPHKSHLVQKNLFIACRMTSEKNYIPDVDHHEVWFGH